MRQPLPNGIPVEVRALAASALVILLLHGGNAMADGLVGLYAGAAFGESRVEADSQGYAVDNFKKDHSAYQFMVGLRPEPVLGLEVDYVDFGHPRSTLNGDAADATLKGAAAFAVFYLPAPVIDIFAKAGLARLESTLNGVDGVQVPCCQPSLFRLDRTDTHFAVGLGAQYKISTVAIRTEYERFDSAGEHPSVWTLGLTWTFL
jgi:opacity protein-like surface antigen